MPYVFVCVFAQGGWKRQHEVLHRPHLFCGAVGAGDGQADPGEQVRAQQETRATQGKVPICLLLMARNILVGMDYLFHFCGVVWVKRLSCTPGF